NVQDVAADEVRMDDPRRQEPEQEEHAPDAEEQQQDPQPQPRHQQMHDQDLYEAHHGQRDRQRHHPSRVPEGHGPLRNPAPPRECEDQALECTDLRGDRAQQRLFGDQPVEQSRAVGAFCPPEAPPPQDRQHGEHQQQRELDQHEQQQRRPAIEDSDEIQDSEREQDDRRDAHMETVRGPQPARSGGHGLILDYDAASQSTADPADIDSSVWNRTSPWRSAAPLPRRSPAACGLSSSGASSPPVTCSRRCAPSRSSSASTATPPWPPIAGSPGTAPWSRRAGPGPALPGGSRRHRRASLLQPPSPCRPPGTGPTGTGPTAAVPTGTGATGAFPRERSAISAAAIPTPPSSRISHRRSRAP